MPRFLLFCRPGFENDCAAEADERFALLGWNGSSRALSPHGLVGYQGDHQDAEGGEGLSSPAKARSKFKVATLPRELVFARQVLECVKLVGDLPADNRAQPIAAAFTSEVGPSAYRALVLEHPDTNEGRALSQFCKKFAPALGNALRREGFTFEPQSRDAPALHVVFLSYEKAYIGVDRQPRGPWKGGVPRLKFPAEAPSRSTLKLEEALLTLLSEKERGLLLREGGHAVDLGAAPGGWTYQLLQKSYYVTAVDNGAIAPELLATGMVDHRQEDAYKFAPKQAVDLVVCDMVDRPQNVTRLMARWLKQKQCRWAIFNLKLPMKKRYDEWDLCRELFWQESQLKESAFELRAKHLYHNREEITVLVKPQNLS